METIIITLITRSNISHKAQFVRSSQKYAFESTPLHVVMQ